MRKSKWTAAMLSFATIGMLLVGCGTESTSGGNAPKQNAGADQTNTPTQTQSSTPPAQNNDSSTSANSKTSSTTTSSTTTSSNTTTSSPSSPSNPSTNQSTSSQSPATPPHNQPGQWIAVTAPQAGTSIHPGMAVPIEGKVAEQAFWKQTLKVTLFSGTDASKQSNTIVHEQDFTIAQDGTFKGTFQLPSSPFPAGGGSSFTMVFQADYPHAPTYSILLTPHN